MDQIRVILNYLPWSLIAGLVVALSAIWIWYRKSKSKSKDTEQKDTDLKASQEKQVVEDFDTAVKLLGDGRVKICLRGIHALERLAKESEDKHWPVMETLTAFIRENAPLPLKNKYKVGDEAGDSEIKTSRIAIQAALAVIGRRSKERRKYEEKHSYRIDLSNSNLNELILEEARFEGASLKGAHFEKADMKRVHLERADLSFANLKKVNLMEARLEGANLERARLMEANLHNAHLEGADLSFANLKKADLDFAHLEKANLSDAYLVGARLLFANLEETILIRANLKRAHLPRANLRRANLNDAYLERANLCDSSLQGAKLKNTYLKKAKYTSHVDDVFDLLSWGEHPTTFPKGFEPHEHGMIDLALPEDLSELDEEEFDLDADGLMY